jgi:hypothetical protein
MSDDDYNFSITAVTTGRTIELPREYEDLLIAIALNLLREMTILDAEFVLEDILDAEVVE